MSKKYPSKQYLSEVISNREFAESVPPEIVIVMARQLLAGMEQEPVGEVVLGDYDDCGDYPDAKVVCTAAQGQADWNNFRNGTKLYAAPQLTQPAVNPLEQFAEFMAAESIKSGDYPDGWQCKASNAAYEYAQYCRAAMLQGEEPVQANTLRDGLAAIRNSGIAIDAGKIQAERDALNEPDVPDGYALVPVEPTEKMIIEGFESVPHPLFQPADWDKYQTMSGCEQAAHRAKLCWAAMIKAAPKP